MTGASFARQKWSERRLRLGPASLLMKIPAAPLLTALLASACASVHPSHPAAAFTPGKARAERKARLLALGPKLDAHLDAKLAEAHATGAAVGIVLDGELVYVRTLGVKDIESKRPVDADTVFRIASI